MIQFINNTQSGGKIIGQGTYGCIFKPGFSCDGGKDSSARYISKLQIKRDSKEGSNEVIFGDIIQNIPNYARYFAPIESACDVDIQAMRKYESDYAKCELFSKQAKSTKPMEFQTSKVRYVGEYTLEDWHIQYMDNNKPNNVTFFKKWSKNYSHLLKAMALLSDNNILHMDLKENNIMCRDKTGMPIVIDFGLSADLSKITEVTSDNESLYRKTFFTSAFDYSPWCFDIQLIAYLVNENIQNQETWFDKKITLLELENTVLQFIKYNWSGMGADDTGVFDVKDKIGYTNVLKDYVKRLHTSQSSPTRKTIVDIVIKNKTKWDTYALNIIYLKMARDLKLNTIESSFEPMLEHIQFLKIQAMAAPDEHLDATEMLNAFKQKKNVAQVPKRVAKRPQTFPDMGDVKTEYAKTKVTTAALEKRMIGRLLLR